GRPGVRLPPRARGIQGALDGSGSGDLAPDGGAERARAGARPLSRGTALPLDEAAREGSGDERETLMCGIAGIVDFGQPPTRESIQAMTDLIRHRGPDDEGIALLGPCGLGHRRLAIIDLS